MRIFVRTPILLALAISACDPAAAGSSFRDKISSRITAAEVSLTQAIEIAQTEIGAGSVIEAELEVEHAENVYDVVVAQAGEAWELRIDATTGEVARRRAQPLDAGDAAELQGEIDLVLGSIGWTAIVDAAEAEAQGTAIEIEVDDGLLSVDVLTNAGVVELDFAPDGTLVRRDDHDDDDWERDHVDGDADDDDDGLDDDADDDDDDDADDDGVDDDGPDDDGADDGLDDDADDDGPDEDGPDDDGVDDDGVDDDELDDDGR